MRDGRRIGVVIPARDEAGAIGKVVAAVPAWVDAIVVADNGSRDETALEAARAGARVVSEQEQGYGAACLAGIRALPPVDVIVFVDGDYSDYPEDMADLVDPILRHRADLVIGSRLLAPTTAASLLPQQRYGNRLATSLISMIWGVRFTDLGPFRAVGRGALERLRMADRNFGWTVEMQIKAAELGLACLEVPARYRRRIGVSKISGTLNGTLMAGSKILWLIGRHAWARVVKRPGRR